MTSSRAARPRVLITDCDHGSVERELEILGVHFEVVVAHCRSEDDVIAESAGVEAVLCQYAPVTARVLDALTDCRVVVRYGVGFDNIDVAAARDRGIWVANVPDYGVEEVADHAVALAYDLLRGVSRLNLTVRDGRWDYRAVRPLHRISGLAIGVVGHGRIGSAFTRRMHALGATVQVADARELPGGELPEGVRQVPLTRLLASSDLVSLHVPAPADGGVLLGPTEFGLMRDGAYLVNTARGALVDEGALLAALNAGRIAGAALDVLQHEPPGDHPLLRHDRVVVTPHSAWYSEQAFRSLKDDAAWEVVRVLSGAAPRSPVNAPVDARRRGAVHV